MAGTVILSHGFNSSPRAVKIAALARVAERLGWQTLRPDSRADDARGHAASVAPRHARLLDGVHRATRPLVLVGSSMGAFVSALVAPDVDCGGLFVLALPVAIPECPRRLVSPRGVPAMLVHGYRDEVCPLADAVAFARKAGWPALLLDDDHGLVAHLGLIAEQFAAFLRPIAG